MKKRCKSSEISNNSTRLFMLDIGIGIYIERDAGIFILYR